MPTATASILGLAMALTSSDAPPGNNALAAPLNNAQGEHAHWSGIGRLNLQRGDQCIASLIDSRGADGHSTGPAYVVTSGHCMDIRNGRIIQDQPTQGAIIFNYFADTPDTRPTFVLKRTIWSSMQGSDLALVELDASLAEVTAAGIHPLALGPSPSPGSEVVMVGEACKVDTGLRASHCTERDEATVTQFPWVWRKLKANDCPASSQGASGSPVIDQATQRLVSVLNSVGTGPTPTNYAIPVQRMLGCFRHGHADLTLESCHLLPGFQFTQQAPGHVLRRLGANSEAPTWNLTFTLDTPRYRYKQARDALECEQANGYSGTIAADEHRIDDPIATEPGRYHLCVVGVQSSEQRPSPALLANALSLPVEVIPAAWPQPLYTLDRHSQGHARINWQSDHPHLSRYLVKHGPPNRMDCNNPIGYRRALTPSQIIPASQLPALLCSRAIDIDGQVAATTAELLPAEIN